MDTVCRNEKLKSKKDRLKLETKQTDRNREVKNVWKDRVTRDAKSIEVVNYGQNSCITGKLNKRI